MALLLGKRGGVQLAAAYFSKSSSSSSTSTSTLRRFISRSLAESSSNVKRVVNNKNTLAHGGGRWAVGGGAVRGYSNDAPSNFSLSNLIQEIQLEVQMLRDDIEEKNQETTTIGRRRPEDASSSSNSSLSEEDRKNMREREISAMQIEVEKLRNDFEKRNKESSERMRLQFENLKEKLKQIPSEELRSGIGSVISHIVQENTAKTTRTINYLDEKIAAYIRLVDGRLNDVRDDLKKNISLAMTGNLVFLSLYVIYHTHTR